MVVRTEDESQGLLQFLRDKDGPDTRDALWRTYLTAPIRPLSYRDAVVPNVPAPEPPRFTETYTCSNEQHQEGIVDRPSVSDALIRMQAEITRRAQEAADLIWTGHFNQFGVPRGVTDCHRTSWMGFQVIEINGVLYDSLEATEYLFDGAAGEPLRVKFLPKPPEVTFREPMDWDGPEARTNISFDVRFVVRDGVFLKRCSTIPSTPTGVEPRAGEGGDSGA